MEEKKKFQIKDLIITALMVLCSQVLYRVLSFLFVSPYTMLLVQYLFNSSTIFKICATMSL